MIRHRGKLLLLLLPFWLTAAPVSADYYRYTDGSGGICFVDDAKKIPANFRKSAVLIREAKTAPVPAAAPDLNGAQPPRYEAESFVTPTVQTTNSPLTVTDEQPPRHWGWLALFIATGVAGVLLFFHLLKTLQSPQLTRIILISVTVGLMLLGHKLYTDQMIDNYFTAKGKLLKLMEKANQREENLDTELH